MKAPKSFYSKVGGWFCPGTTIISTSHAFPRPLQSMCWTWRNYLQDHLSMVLNLFHRATQNSNALEVTT